MNHQSVMAEIETINTNDMERKEADGAARDLKDSSQVEASISSPTNNRKYRATKMEQRSPSPSTKEAATAISVSAMQASFAERTASEMAEILDWYKKNEGGDNLLKRGNQQRQSMPDNAMIADEEDDDDEEDDEDVDALLSEQLDEITPGEEIISTYSQDQHQQCVIGDDESVLVKDYYTPTQKAKEMKRMGCASSTTSRKSRNLFSSILRTLSKSGKCDDDSDDHDPPPSAIKIQDTEDDEVSVLSSLLHTPKVARKTMLPAAAAAAARSPIMDAIADAIAASGHSLSQDQNQIVDDIVITKSSSSSIVGFFDEEKKVLAMLSPNRCKEPLPTQTCSEPESRGAYVDHEKEVLEMLSPSGSNIGNTKSDPDLSYTGVKTEDPIHKGKETSMPVQSCHSTEQEAHSQIEAADELIRNTQNMAEIIARLKLPSSSFSCGSDDDDDHESFDNESILDDNSIDGNEVSPSSLLSSSSTTPTCPYRFGEENDDVVSTTHHNSSSDVGIRTRFMNNVSNSIRRRRGKREKESTRPLATISSDNTQSEVSMGCHNPTTTASYGNVEEKTSHTHHMAVEMQRYAPDFVPISLSSALGETLRA